MTNALRVRHRTDLDSLVETTTRTRTTDDWLHVLEGCGVPYAAVNDVQGALTHEQTVARGMVVEVEHPACGSVKVVNTPVKYSEATPGVRTAPPMLGQHTEMVLTRLGYPEGEVARLKEEGVVS